MLQSLHPTVRRVASIAGFVGAFVGVVVLFEAMSAHTVVDNSDGATVILEGAAIKAGNIGLHGWTLSLDSFWTSDALFYALGVAVLGISPVLFHLVPAVIAALLVAVAVALAIDRRRGLAAVSAAALVVVVVVLGPVDLQQYLLAGPLHIGTALFCLCSFALLAKRPNGWRLALASVLLAAGTLGDLQELSFGIVPVVFAGLLLMAIERQVRAGVGLVATGVCAGALAVLVRLVAGALGAFHLISAEQPAALSSVGRNVSNLWINVRELVGVSDVAFLNYTHEQPLTHLVRAVLLAVILVGALAASVGVVVSLVTGRALGRDERATRTQLLLVVALWSSIAEFFYLAALAGNYSRYVVVPLVFATVLAARELGGLLARVAPSLRASAAVLLLGCLIAAAASVASDLTVESPSSTKAQLATFLEAHNLHVGLAGYLIAPLVTVESHGDVLVRPVIEEPGGRIVRWARQSSSSWYAGVPFSFVVLEPSANWRGVSLARTELTFGAPAHVYTDIPYEVLVYAHPLEVSTVGSEGVSTTHRAKSASARAQ